jgi:hypothetical protein
VGASSANASMTIALYIKKHATISNQLKHKKTSYKNKNKNSYIYFSCKSNKHPPTYFVFSKLA